MIVLDDQVHFSRCEMTLHEDLPGRARSVPTSHEDMPQPLELTTSCFLLWSCRIRRVCVAFFFVRALPSRLAVLVS